MEDITLWEAISAHLKKQKWLCEVEEVEHQSLTGQDKWLINNSQYTSRSQLTSVCRHWRGGWGLGVARADDGRAMPTLLSETHSIIILAKRKGLDTSNNDQCAQNECNVVASIYQHICSSG